MRLSDYVMARIAGAGVLHVFTVCGGGSIFLCDSLARSKELKYVACHHEQAAAMAAEGYARTRNGLGVVLVTSGPGGTNAITGAAGAWTDHVRMLVISGQSFLNQTTEGSCKPVRTLGVQEINIIDIVRPITKYAAMVTSAQSIAAHLDRALHHAMKGRPGPVWLDIPADIQKAEIDPEKLPRWNPPQDSRPNYDEALPARVLQLLKKAKRPLLHVGQGVRIANAQGALEEFLKWVRIPVVTARNGNDLIASDHPQYVGRPGTFAQRGANFAVQTCDLYLAIGTRLSLAQTGYNAKDYARNATVVMVDIDRHELDKDTLHIDLKVRADAEQFLDELLITMQGANFPDWSAWLARCKEWQQKYPPVLQEQREQGEWVNSYHFIDRLSDMLEPTDVVVTDMGFAFQNTHQAFRVKAGQRLFTNCGLAAMGWGLPAAIGAAVAKGGRVVCIAGDGGLMFNLQELSTLAHHGLPVKIFLLNNGGYLTMRQSQENAFDTYMGSDGGSGLSFPDFGKVADSFGIVRHRVEEHRVLDYTMRATLAHPGPVLCELVMDPKQAQIPKSINRRLADGSIKQTALEDAHPYLSPEEIAENLRV